MVYEVVFHSKAENFFNKLDNSIKRQISKGISKLEKNPLLGKPLAGNLFGIRSLCEGKFRILYKIENEKLIVFILDIGHRKNVYG